MTYKNCKLIITRKAYKTKEELQEKMDMFFAFNRITSDEYIELTGLLEGGTPA